MNESANNIDISFSKLMNLSFQNENNNREYIPEEVTQKNPYIMEDHVPEIEIINKNEMTCDKKNIVLKII